MARTSSTSRAGSSNHASRLYSGEGKTDAKDAAVIADQATMRKDLQRLRAGDETSTGLRILTARRADKSADRTGAINRLRAQLLERTGAGRTFAVGGTIQYPRFQCYASANCKYPYGREAPWW